MKLSLLVSVLTLAVSSAAFANTVYFCQPEDDLPGSTDQAVILEGHGAIVFASIELDRVSDGDAPAGFTEYQGSFGCPQSGPGFHCGAHGTITAYVSDSMVDGQPTGSLVNGYSSHNCEKQTPAAQ